LLCTIVFTSKIHELGVGRLSFGTIFNIFGNGNYVITLALLHDANDTDDGNNGDNDDETEDENSAI